MCDQEVRTRAIGSENNAGDNPLSEERDCRIEVLTGGTIGLENFAFANLKRRWGCLVK